MSDPVRAAATVVLLRPGSVECEVLLLRRPRGGAFGGGWVFPGGKVEDSDPGGDNAERSRAAAVRETQEEVGLTPATLHPISRWMPPPQAPARFETWFYVAEDPGGEIVPQPGEVEEWQWMTPTAALAAQRRGELTLFPPTWITLYSLQSMRSLADVVAKFPVAEYFAPRLDGVIGHGTLYLYGDAEYVADAPAEGRHRLEMQETGWLYTRR